MTTAVPALATLFAAFAWLGAIDRMSASSEPFATRLSAYLTFALLVIVGGCGLVAVHQQVEPINQVLAAALYTGIEAAGAVIGWNARRAWRV